ncbi:hypothetical protein L3Q82_016460, partial [Scortum barcoo]
YFNFLFSSWSDHVISCKTSSELLPLFNPTEKNLPTTISFTFSIDTGRTERTEKDQRHTASMAQKFVILLVLLSAAASAEDVVKVKPGEDAVLRCEPGDVSIRAAEWTRDDLKSEEYVLLYRDGKPDTTFQHPSFRGRVQLVDGDLKNRDVSLILKNVNINDAGTYECRVAAGSRRTKRSNTDPLIRSIRLEVNGPENENFKDDNPENHSPLDRNLTGLFAVLAVSVLAKGSHYRGAEEPHEGSGAAGCRPLV